MQARAMAGANQGKALGHRLWAFCKPHYTLVKQNVTEFVTTFKGEGSKTADASFQDGLWHAFLTCVVLAPPPLMYMLYMVNVSASYYREVPLWYGLVLFMNVPEKKMMKTVAKCVFVAVACLLWYCGIWHWAWALPMCLLSVQTMKGNGKVLILWQLRGEVIMYLHMRQCVIEIRKMEDLDKEAVVEADDMIRNPDTFLLCCMAAFTWKTWAKIGWNFNLRSWTRILSCKRAFVALMFWRILFFGIMPYCVYLFVMCVYGIAMYLCSAGEPAKPEFHQSTPEPETNGTRNLTQAEREAKFAKWREYAKERAKK
jgi:hypothetical protein